MTANTDPDSECADQGAASCGSNGTGCNGNANAPDCNLHASATICVAQSCTTAEVTTDALCDGAGTCVSGNTTSCEPYRCDGSGLDCRSSCADDTECTATNYCSSPTCVAKLTNGTACSAANWCLSGECVDGVCCDAACSGDCESCLLANTGVADGTCAFVPAGSDPESECATTQACNGAGACRTTDGNSCTDGAECLSGYCPTDDGVCCNEDCADTCEACLLVKNGVADGTCGLVPSGNDPDTECSDEGLDTCGANGTGCTGTAASCNLYGAGLVCSAGSCAAGVETGTALCDGAGTCVPGTPSPCSPYLCNSGGTACRTTCTLHTDCVSTHYCDGVSCVPKKSNGVSCGEADQCTSGFCPADDGICCDLSCTGECEACDATKTGGTDGVCDTVTHGEDPDDECAGAAECIDGACGTCDERPAPPGGTCPGVCTSCDVGTNTCIIDCPTTSCKDQTHNCPAGWACQVNCSGIDACSGNTVVNCPASYACDVICTAEASCKGLDMRCGTGTCTIGCTGTPNACQDAVVDCGLRECRATCGGGAGTPALSCNNSCNCVSC
ncbi:MAG: hypothetical protein JRI23_02405 [Deltaproteobacteria bacterium]|nr:hypothetical protein [Deltaproteobacteria bacterium]MBW2530338.1 hypothetical protein [Deltaproteobacteria bacterium]